MKALVNYVETQSRWDQIFGKPPMDFPLNEDQIRSIADSLDAQMSPENLTCDGELSGAQVRERARYYKRVAMDLQEYAQSMDYPIPTFYEI